MDELDFEFHLERHRFEVERGDTQALVEAQSDHARSVQAALVRLMGELLPFRFESDQFTPRCLPTLGCLFAS